MVLGLSREGSTIANLSRSPVVLDRSGPVFGWDDWLIERGAVTWEGSADVTGGFPGFATHGARLDGCQVRVTERFLLVDEGRGHGFGLPLAWLIDADVITSPFRGDRGETVLRVRYNDRDRARTFLVRFRGPFMALWGGWKAENALTALRDVGLEAGSEAMPPVPEIAHSWLEASRFERENVIWSGVASASLGPGNELEPCDVWLTTRSVIWGGGMGDGVLRLPLERLVDVVSVDLESRRRTPAIYLACLDDGGGRHDLPFIFDRQHPAQRCHRERGALIVGLRSRGIPLGMASSPPQPWRSALARVAAVDDSSIDHGHGGGASFRFTSSIPGVSARAVTAETNLGEITNLASKRYERRLASRRLDERETDDPADWSLGPDRPEAVGVAVSATAEDLDHSGRSAQLDHQSGYVRPCGRQVFTLVPKPRVQLESSETTRMDEPTEISGEGAVTRCEDSPVVVAQSESPIAVVDAFEDAIVAVLIEAAQGIDRCLSGAAWTPPVRPVPSAERRMAALDALDNVAVLGLLEADVVRSRRDRLVAAGDAGPRLRSLLELRAARLITDAQLAGKRVEIMAPLADVLRGGVE